MTERGAGVGGRGWMVGVFKLSPVEIARFAGVSRPTVNNNCTVHDTGGKTNTTGIADVYGCVHYLLAARCGVPVL